MAAFQKPVRKLVCENSLFNVFFEKVKSSDGKVIPNYLVVSPKHKSKKMVSGVSILPIIGNKFALLRIYRYPIQEESWEIPRGFIEKGENSKVSVIRELEEETGLTCRKSNIISLGYITPEAGVFEARLHLFVAKHCKAGRVFTINEIGHKELKLFTKAQMARMIRQGKIQDPSTLICFYRSSERLKH